jgi:rhodanese-related sulfurtransferase
MKILIFSVILCITMLIFVACKTNKKSDTMFENLSSSAFEQALAADSNAVLLDVRTNTEVAESRLPNSLHIDIQHYDFENKIGALDKTKNYYIYCRSGGRSSTACAYMQSIGFGGKIVNLDGGITHWEGKKE